MESRSATCSWPALTPFQIYDGVGLNGMGFCQFRFQRTSYARNPREVFLKYATVALQSLCDRFLSTLAPVQLTAPGPYSAPRLGSLLVRKAKFFGPHFGEHVVSQYVERVVYRSIWDRIQPKLDQ